MLPNLGAGRKQGREALARPLGPIVWRAERIKLFCNHTSLVELLEAERREREPFYFKSYDRVIGVAHDVKELASEMERLAKEDPAALEHHLREGHIVAWLNYIGEARLAEALKGVSEPREALSRVKVFLTPGGQGPSGEGGQAQGPKAFMGPGPRGRKGRRARMQG